MIKTTYLRLRMAVPALQKLFQQDLSSLKVLLKLKKLIDLCEKEFQLFEDARMKLVMKYGEEVTDNEQGTYWKVKDENMQTFTKELEEVLSEEVLIDTDKISISSLEKALIDGSFKLSVADLKSLEDFIDATEDQYHQS